MRRDWRTLFLPYDLYERHQVVSELLRDRVVQNVLDVGGRAGLLSRFTGANVTALNVDASGDLLYDGGTLPFPDDRFDVVVTIDTLEHIPQDERLGFLRECWRVARKYLIVAAPWGSVGHVASEKRLNDLYCAVQGRPHVYLDQHVRYGLPTEAHLEEFVRLFGVGKYRLCFAGDYRWQSKYFERTLLSRERRRFFRLRAFFDHVFSLALFHPVRLKDQPHPFANRFYLFVEESHTCQV